MSECLVRHWGVLVFLVRVDLREIDGTVDVCVREFGSAPCSEECPLGRSRVAHGHHDGHEFTHVLEAVGGDCVVGVSSKPAG